MNYRHYFALEKRLQKAGYPVERAELVNSLTRGRTKSLRALTHIEYTVLIDQMRGLAAKAAAYDSAESLALEAERKRKRSQVLAIATRTGLHDVKDWRKFNAFMEERSILKKPLNKYSLAELNALVRQFRGIEANYKKSATKPGTAAWHHSRGFPPISSQ